MKGLFVACVVAMLVSVHAPTFAQQPTCNCPSTGIATPGNPLAGRLRELEPIILDTFLALNAAVANPGNPGVGACCNCAQPVRTCCCPAPPPRPEKCGFSIYMSRARVVQGQGLFDGKLELQLTGYANGATVTHPSASTWTQIHKRWDWVSVNRLITTMVVEKGSPKLVAVMADAVEFEAAIGGLPEIGSSSFNQLNLSCGQTSTATVSIELKKIGIVALSQKGTVEVEFRAYEQ